MSNREDNTEREYRNSNAWGESLTDAQKCAVLDRMRRTTNWASVVAWASQGSDPFGQPTWKISESGKAQIHA